MAKTKGGTMSIKCEESDTERAFRENCLGTLDWYYIPCVDGHYGRLSHLASRVQKSIKATNFSLHKRAFL